MCLLHLIILVCCFTRDSFAQTINENGFIFKLFFVILATFGLFFMPNEYLRGYVTASSYLGVLFLIYQSITLIDFGYVWNDKWLAKYENGRQFYGILMILFSLGLLTLIILSTMHNFNTFWIDSCIYYKFNLTTSVLVILGLISLSLMQI